MSYVVILFTTALSAAKGMLEPCKNLYNVTTNFFPTQIRFLHLDDHPSMCGLKSSTNSIKGPSSHSDKIDPMCICQRETCQTIEWILA